MTKPENLTTIVMKENNILKIVKIVLLSIAGLIAVMLGLSFILSMGMGEIKRLSINDVDLAKISDGVYEGKYYKGRWTYDARVTVKDHRITEVANTNKRMGMLKDFNTKAEKQFLLKQSPRIDVVSGATINTKAFQKAVENALEPAPRK